MSVRDDYPDSMRCDRCGLFPSMCRLLGCPERDRPDEDEDDDDDEDDEDEDTA